MKENQMQSGGADCLPLVGPGAITELQLLNTTTHCEGKPTQSGGADCLPLVGPRKSKSNQKGSPFCLDFDFRGPTSGRQSAPPDCVGFPSRWVVVFKSCNSVIAPGPTNGRQSAPPDCIWFSFIAVSYT